MDASRNPLNHCRCFAVPVFPAILCKISRQYGNFSSRNINIGCHGINCFTKVTSQAMADQINFSLQRALPRFSRPAHQHRSRREPVHHR
ncbi:hypothetical protein F9K85_20595 [Brucella tritici]|uniref:Uncharacterized protein n=1 Tax=Brucella tritici TaxID=94626 RepID=A0A6L3YV97_9HYPH|nr:hypothetical protein F9K94_01845 [Brucella tritici]KAB2665880.1 hypothetical protein F9K91_07015 [Brucella tritici]KAB2673323.1 hypothetical protein F9K85_20595 [Brucella tritici]KAB2688877.1 hypothetical protein F9L08_04205 [Brucella tritici]